MTEREKLISAMSAAMTEACMKRSGYPLTIVEADMSAALDVALEEAAMVADANALEAWDFGADETRGLMRLQAADIAAAIRALKEKP